MVAAAGAAVAAVDHEFFRAEPRLPRLLVKRLGDGDSFVPVRGGVDVHFDDAWIGRDLDDIETAVDGRRDSLRYEQARP